MPDVFSSGCRSISTQIANLAHISVCVEEGEGVLLLSIEEHGSLTVWALKWLPPKLKRR